MKKYILILFAVSITISVTTSCKKKKQGCMDPISANYDSSAEEDDGSCAYGGLGGNTTIVAYPQHHGKDTRPYLAVLVSI